MSETTQLAFVLDTAAAEMRQRILRDRKNGLDPREETLTQNLISNLAIEGDRLGLRVVAREVPKVDEARLLGADVALWVQGASGRLSGLHLQAKRQYRDDTYRDLARKNKHGSQIDTLMSGARDSSAGAGYVFYNGLRSDQPSESPCCLLDYSPARNGITVSAADGVRAAITTKDGYRSRMPRSAVEGVSFPLGCVARCWTHTRPNSEDDLGEAMSSWWRSATGELLPSVEGVESAPEYLLPLLTQMDLERLGGEDLGPWTERDDDGDEDTASVLLISSG